MNAIEEKSAKVWDGKITGRVKVAGKGSPVVFFHDGYGLNWNPFLDKLAERHTVFAPELPGTSEGDPNAIQELDNLWDLTLYYDELLDALGIEAAALVGHSFGGMVACEVAAHNPRRVQRLVLIAPLGLWLDEAPIPNYHVMSPEELVPLVVSDSKSPLAQAMLSIPEDPEVRVKARIRKTWALACTGKFIWPIPDKGLKKRLHRITAPTLLLWGKQDRLVKPVYAEAFKKLIRNSRVHLLDNAAHMAHVEQVEAATNAIEEFLRQ